MLSAARSLLGIALGCRPALRRNVLALDHRRHRFTVDFSFVLDQLSLVMLLVITGVGFLIHIYSVGYMHDEQGYWRYFAYLNLFLFFMTTLVLAGNALLMFVGWEGVGLASYLLIGFWFTKTPPQMLMIRRFAIPPRISAHWCHLLSPPVGGMKLSTRKP